MAYAFGLHKEQDIKVLPMLFRQEANAMYNFIVQLSANALIYVSCWLNYVPPGHMLIVIMGYGYIWAPLPTDTRIPVQ